MMFDMKSKEVDLKFKRIVEIWLFGFCCGVIACVFIHYVNNEVR